MQDVMARIRITIDTEQEYKRAFLARAAIEGLSPQELFEKLVREYCSEDVERARGQIGDDDPDPPKKKPKK